jgi:hypothetical protein
VHVAAGVLKARVGEFEIQTVVVGHGYLPPQAGTPLSRRQSNSVDYDLPALRELKETTQYATAQS